MQLDQLPKEYDQATAQRVLESAVRRVTDEMEDEPQKPNVSDAGSSEDPLPWVI